MKIRSGFVSNSSSASFVVAFPPNFDVTELVKKAIEDDEYFGSDEEEKEFLNQDFSNWFNNDIWDCEEHEKFSITREILNDSNIISSFDVSSSDGQIQNLFSNENIDSFKKVLKNPVVRDYIKELIKESESDEN